MKNKDNTYSVRGYDSFSNEDYPIAKGLTKEEAFALADKKGGTMNLIYVFDKDKNIVKQTGSY